MRFPTLKCYKENALGKHLIAITISVYTHLSAFAFLGKFEISVLNIAFLGMEEGACILNSFLHVLQLYITR